MKVFLAILALACAASASVVPAGLIPPLDPRLEVNGSVSLDLDDRVFKGHVELTAIVVYGLDTVTDDLKLNLVTLDVKGTAQAVTLRVTASFKIDVLFNSETIGKQVHVVGSGELDATVTGGHVALSADFKLNIITQILSLRGINVTPKISTAKVAATGVTADGEPIDFDAVGADLPAVLDKYFAEHQQDFNNAITPKVNEVLAQHTLAEWLKIIGQSK